MQMQEPGRLPVPPFAGVDLRRPKGYPLPSSAAAKETESEEHPAPDPTPGGDPCPRCGSRDTKFCYYNNYNTSQPRHFCKSCRRYWTKGGSLRNVPVGGGTRKTTTATTSGSSSSSSTSSSASPAATTAPNIKNTKRSKNSKRRRVAPAPDATADVANAAPSSTEAAATVVSAGASELEKPAVTEPATAGTDTEKPAAAPAAVGGFTDDDTSTAAGLGVAGVGDGVGGGGGVKQELVVADPSHFEWPSGCDLGSYWGTASVFADTDPALFLNLP